MELVATQIFNGLSLGSILLLISIGLAFSFGLMNVINMAHGEFIMVGAYVTFLLQSISPLVGGLDAGIWFLLSLPVAFVVTGALGWLLEITIVSRLYSRPLDTLLATWGVGLMLQQLARTIFGAPNVQVTSPAWLNGGVNVLEMTFPYKRIFIMVLVAVVISSIYVYLYHSARGRRMRAVMQNREIASTLGVNSRTVDGATFALGAGLAGVAGCALTLIGPIGPSIGTYYIVDSFMVVVLGGVGQLVGTIAAALLFGGANTLLELGTTASMGKVLVFILIIAFLQWRPSGLAKLRTR